MCCQACHFLMRSFMTQAGATALLLVGLIFLSIGVVDYNKENNNTWITVDETVLYTNTIYRDCYTHSDCVFSNESTIYTCKQVDGVSLDKLNPGAKCSIPEVFHVLDRQVCDILNGRCIDITTAYGYYSPELADNVSTRNISNLCISNLFCEKTVYEHQKDYIRTVYYRKNSPGSFYTHEGKYDRDSAVTKIALGVASVFIGLLVALMHITHYCKTSNCMSYEDIMDMPGL